VLSTEKKWKCIHSSPVSLSQKPAQNWPKWSKI